MTDQVQPMDWLAALFLLAAVTVITVALCWFAVMVKREIQGHL